MPTRNAASLALSHYIVAAAASLSCLDNVSAGHSNIHPPPPSPSSFRGRERGTLFDLGSDRKWWCLRQHGQWLQCQGYPNLPYTTRFMCDGIVETLFNVVEEKLHVVSWT